VLYGWLESANLAPVTVSCGANTFPWDAAAYCMTIFCGLWVSVIFGATTYKWMLKPSDVQSAANDIQSSLTLNGGLVESPPDTPSFFHRLVDCFALQKSAPAMFRMAGDRSGQLASLNGMRVLSMSLVILGHTLYFVPAYTNPAFEGPVQGAFSDWRFQVIPSAEFAVDTFFLMSGFLATHLLLREVNKLFSKEPSTAQATALKAPLLSLVGDGDAQPDSFEPAPKAMVIKATGFYGMAIFHRYVRLTPVLAIIIGVYTALFPLFGNGPLWVALQDYQTGCQQYWWTNLLYINTYVPSKMDSAASGCLGWTWYLSLDMQLFLLTPLFALIFLRSRIAGYIVVGITLCASLIAAEEVVRQNSLSALLTPTEADAQHQGDSYNLFYDKVWTRAGPYLIGVLLAFLLVSFPKSAVPPPSRPTWQTVFVLAATLAVIGVLFYTPVSAYQTNYNSWSEGQIIFYSAFSRTLWAIACAVLLYLCFTGRGGFLNSFLSLPLFEPLARLTYGSYLVHPIVMQYFYFTAQSLPTYGSNFMSVYYVSNAAYAYIIAGLVFLTLEYPIGALEKLLVHGNKPTARHHHHHALKQDKADAQA
jgi:peptidoglycan/LPS O-acetylase OafA/YrhL